MVGLVVLLHALEEVRVVCCQEDVLDALPQLKDVLL